VANCRLIIWDEALSSNKEVIDAVARATSDFKRKVLLCISDAQQILPVVHSGTKFDILASTIVNHRLFDSMETLHLKTNMRLVTATKRNKEYLHMISAIAINDVSSLNKIFCASTGEDDDIIYHVLSSKLNCFFDFVEEQEEEGVVEDGNVDTTSTIDDWNTTFMDTTVEERNAFVDEVFKERHGRKALLETLFPNNVFSSKIAMDLSILAVSNKEVDEWNALIGDMNPAEECIMKSKDYYTEV
jgi:hypothetical protein